MTPEQELSAHLAELERRLRRPLLDGLFPQQRDFVSDPSRRKAALCTRRSGKSWSVAAYLLDMASREARVTCAYVTLTRGTARRFFWPIVKALNETYHLGATFNETGLEARLPNGSTIFLTGADDAAEIEKLRGGHYLLVVIDEAASLGSHLETLIKDVVSPALMDLNGTLALIGTPGAACVGMFHEVSNRPPGTERGWSLHKWTVLDNIHRPQAREWLAQEREQNGWTDETPVYRREWLGQWVRDESSMVYRWDAARNTAAVLPDGLEHVLGVDLGFDDDSAIEVVSFSRSAPKAYIHHGWKRSGCTVSDLADQIAAYVERWKPTRIVADTGGIGKMVVEELSKRRALPVHAAEKTDKRGAIEWLNADLVSGRVQVLSGDPVIREWEVLQWDEDRRKEDERYANHLSDAALYAYREARHWLYKAGPEVPLVGSEEHWKKEAKAMEQRAIDRLTPKGEEWWENQ